MRVLVTGGAGLLGSALAANVPDHHQVEITVRRKSPAVPGIKQHVLDLRQSMAFLSVVERRRPDLVIHTAYDKTDHAATVDIASEVATVCGTYDVPLIHLSTDAVFDGTEAPYGEGSSPTPITEYGRAKARCEAIVTENCEHPAIVRTSLIIAADGTDGTSSWVIDAMRRGESVTLFTDEIRTPILVDDLARQLWELVDLEPTDRTGTWHLAGPERLSRVDVGTWLAARHGLDTSLIEQASSAGLQPPRPADVSLSSERVARLTAQARTLGSV